ncbi:hypothetical protein BU16DRAFT_162430 [Lophium mytilinum]|uniref:DUF7730 domain-containing protein n=1 Tax=Lophium mytilinum TaxID=390894 RepID=A0A6A6QDW2_9PEZI|nr:hypothetical protein BU16DRAFT_162430 [Lophium mytilinum]
MQSESPFLTLPAELRLIIYEFLFYGAHLRAPRPSRGLALLLTCTEIHAEASRSEASSRALALLLTCKQVHTEASKLAFSLTNFILPAKVVRELNHYLDTLPRALIASIRHVTVEGHVWVTLLKTWDPKILTLETLTATTFRGGLTERQKHRSEYLNDQLRRSLFSGVLGRSKAVGKVIISNTGHYPASWFLKSFSMHEYDGWHKEAFDGEIGRLEFTRIGPP